MTQLYEDGWVKDPEGNKNDTSVDLLLHEMDPPDPEQFVGLKAWAKWDGCTHIWDYGVSDENPDYWHVCSLDLFIEKMIKLRDKVKEEFAARGREWPPG